MSITKDGKTTLRNLQGFYTQIASRFRFSICFKETETGNVKLHTAGVTDAGMLLRGADEQTQHQNKTAEDLRMDVRLQILSQNKVFSIFFFFRVPF